MDEVDPACPMLQYIASHLHLDMEQRFWLAWLYSTCYSAPTAYYMLTKFPTSHSMTPERMNNWWKLNRHKLVFESDRRYVKSMNRFPAMFESYLKFTGGVDSSPFKRNRKSTPGKTYEALYRAIDRALYFYGRFSIFNYLETVYNLTHFPQLATGVDLKYARTVRNGLCYATGHDDWVRKKKERMELNQAQVSYLQAKLTQLYKELKREHPEVPTTYRNLETGLCAYYKLFIPSRYAGYYIDRQMLEIETMQKLAPDCNWGMLWKFRRDNFDPLSLGEVQGYHGIRESMIYYFLETGQFVEHEQLARRYR